MSKENAPIEIQVGEMGAAFVSRHARLLKIDHQPAGLNFYKIRFIGASRGSASLSSGARKFLIEHIISITGTEDSDFKDEGLSEFSINSSITESDLISHDEARLKFFAVLHGLLNAGWKTTIPRGTPRLRGKDMTNYRLQTKEYTTLDPSYVPSLEEWMRMRSLTGWEFYANHTYLRVTFTRERTLTDPTRPGAYLVSFDLKNEAEQFRGHVDGPDRKRWKEVLPKELNELAQQRVKSETELRLLGIKIDETYLDPPMPDLSKK